MQEAAKPGLTVVSGHRASPDSGREVRCAVRFPVSLPVVIQAGSREHRAQTRNVSASGVLFEMQTVLKVGDSIEFNLRMPGPVLGTPHDVLVDCRGRVVRCSKRQAQTQIAATIDDYQFVEQ